MMDDRAITEYKMIKKVCDRAECAAIDPLGQCTVDDCMQCQNARVKITRQDGVVMRDDFTQEANIRHENNLSLCKWLLQREGVSLVEDAYKATGIDLIEKMYDVKFTKFQRWILERVLKKQTKELGNKI